MSFTAAFHPVPFPRPLGGGLLAALLLLPLGASLPAQEITAGATTSLVPVPAPDLVPTTPRHRLHPDYPREMINSRENGYVLVFRYVDASGKTLMQYLGASAEPFGRAVEHELPEWEWRVAQRSDQPVDDCAWMSFIFNPRAAAVDAPDALPRLLAVAPVFVANVPLSDHGPTVVPMRLRLDAAGSVVAAEPASQGVKPDLLAAIQASLKFWRFAPARQSGRAVPAEITQAVVCMPPYPQPDGVPNVPPRPLRQTAPEYPMAMRAIGLRGEVTVRFGVDVDGSVVSPVVIRSDNPAFDEPAIEALLQWRFAPGTRGGKAVRTESQVSLLFRLEGGSERDAFTVNQSRDQSKLPPELRYDVAPKIRNVRLPVHPTDLWRDGKTGRAKVIMLVGPDGGVSQVRVVEADQPEFGRALAAAVECFRFDPAYRAGQPTTSLLTFESRFEQRWLSDPKVDSFLRLEKKHPEKILSVKQLDRPLKPLSRQPPEFPVSAGTGVAKGSATIDCLIDETGRVRLPRIREASDPAFGYAAIQALSAWWFEPPVAKGRPAVVRVYVPFEFSRKQ